MIDVRKAINMFKKVNVPVLGLIQNMSYLEENSKKNFIFGKNGVLNEAKLQNLNFLGEIPIYKKISKSGDIGEPCSFSDQEVGEIFEDITENLLDSMKKVKIKNVKIE